MNEREAIKWILEELKEQRKQDFDMYFEMRKQTTMRYDALMNRLRFIDEQDRRMNVKEPIKVEPITNLKAFQKPVAESILMNHIKEVEENGLPKPRSMDMTPVELMAERTEDFDEEEEEEYAEDDGVMYEDDEEEEVKQKPSQRVGRRYPHPDDVVEAIEEFLRRYPTKWFKTRQIKREIEKEFDFKWANFSEVMIRTSQLSPYIQMNRNGRFMMFKYKSV